MSSSNRNNKFKNNILNDFPKQKKFTLKENFSENRLNLYEKPEYTKQIGNYVLFDEIGTGTFSKVSKAFHIITEQTVAVKILNKQKIIDDKDVERIYREMDILKKIFHPNICQLYESYVTVHNYYLILEYIDGGDLFDYITNNKYLSEEESCKFYRQLISVIEYLNTMNIAHRDIKPENILLDSKHQNIKLIDFGLSNYYTEEELLKSSCGSPCYASPEMLSGNPYQGIATDIWSSGIVLYSMLMGTLPFSGQELLSLYRQIKAGKFYLPSTLSLEAMDLLKKLLQVNPKNRISLNEIKEHKWFKFDNSPIYKGIFLINNEKISVNQEVFNYMINNYFANGISKEELYKMIEENKCNKYTATYHIIKKNIMKIDDKDKMFQKLDYENLKNILDDIKDKNNSKTTNSSENDTVNKNSDAKNCNDNNAKIKSRNSNDQNKVPFNTDRFYNTEEKFKPNISYNKNGNNLTNNLNRENSTKKKKLFSEIKEKIVNIYPKNNINKKNYPFHKKEYPNTESHFYTASSNRNKVQNIFPNEARKSEGFHSENNNEINIEFKKKPIEFIILKRNKINENQNQTNNKNDSYIPKFDNYNFKCKNDINIINSNLNKNIQDLDQIMSANRKNLNIEINYNNRNIFNKKNYYTHNTSPSNLLKNNINCPIHKNSTLVQSSSNSNKKVNNMNFYVINNFINNKKNNFHYKKENSNDNKKFIIYRNIDPRNKFSNLKDVRSNNLNYSKNKTESKNELSQQHKAYNKIKVNLKNGNHVIDSIKTPELLNNSKKVKSNFKISSTSKENLKIIDHYLSNTCNNNFMNNTVTSIFYKNKNNNNQNEKLTKLNRYTSLTTSNSLSDVYNKKLNSTVNGENYCSIDKKNDIISKEIKIEENLPIMENINKKFKQLSDVYNKKIIAYGQNNNSKPKINNKTSMIDNKNNEKENIEGQSFFEKKRMRYKKKNLSDLNEKLIKKGIIKEDFSNKINVKIINNNCKGINESKKVCQTFRIKNDVK